MMVMTKQAPLLKPSKENPDTYALDDIAIFYRTNSQTRIFEDALRRNNIPYKIYGSLEFYDRVEIKDLMAYLKFINNKKDALSLKRVINTPTRGLGPKAWDLLEEKIEFFEGDCEKALESLAAENVARVSSKLNLFIDLFLQLKPK